jgi:hypothetical protein
MLIAHTVNRSSGNEEMVVSFGDSNYKFISYRKCHWNHKRLSRISSWRWNKRESISVSFVYKTVRINPKFTKVVNDETILKILYHYRGYLEGCGLRNFNRLDDVILNQEFYKKRNIS